MLTQRAHIGQHIRDDVIPVGMSVTAAAKLLGVGRPALSNLLNGRASLSDQMALRLERTFGADREELLGLHRSQVRVAWQDQDREVAVRGYVPSFLTIKARDIEQWADRSEAREQLPVVLRKLVHATGRDVTRVDFPGFDNSQRPGWDGLVEANTATAWIPAGCTGWEFSTEKNCRRKADSDYANRLSLPRAERARCTFVFVTPRNWRGRTEWAKAKESSGDGWKGVRAYDASDLEQWLDDAVTAPLWFAEQCLGLPVQGVKTIDRAWMEWAQVSDPPMSAHIFAPNVKTSLAKFKSWLNEPPTRPFVVASDSIDETIAFVACLFRATLDAQSTGTDAVKWRAKHELAVVFESADTLTRLASSSAPFIPIAANAEVEQALAPFCNRLHCIIPCMRDAVVVEPDIALELIRLDAFHAALDDMGVHEDQRPRLERESGRSPTILRRRLSTVPAIKAPPWAEDTHNTRRLIPMVLVGAWRADSKGDREVLSTLADLPYQEIEQAVLDALALDDSPVWSVGAYRGVVSKVDALFAVAPRVTRGELDDFLLLAEYVLSESDPALELPEGERWAAAFYEKLRDHSDALRDGICQTLVLLATHGTALFGRRLGIDAAGDVEAMVRKLLEPLTTDRLESQERDLPSFAEAAPDTVLKLLEADLAKVQPSVHALLRPAQSAPFAHCPRTGLLWALECIAWNPAYLWRVCAVLAQLASVPIQDNWVNRPIESLRSILRSWMPQTAASLDERLATVRMLAKFHRHVGWQICIGEFSPGMQFATGNYRPKWRGDAAGAGGRVIEEKVFAFQQTVWGLLMSWDHDVSTLGDLVERTGLLGDENQLMVWQLVDDWIDAEPDDGDRAVLRERIRTHCLTRRGRRHGSDALVKRAREAFDRLLPEDPISRNAWLFAAGWVNESWDEVVDDHLDWQARDKRIDEQRQAAMAEVWIARGLEGVFELVERGNAAEVVGRYVASCAEGASATEDVLRQCLADERRNNGRIDTFMRGFIGAVASSDRPGILLGLGRSVGLQRAERLLCCAPFRAATWRILDELPRQVRRGYWQRVMPFGFELDPQECNEVIDRLLEARRPRAAFAAMAFHWKNVDHRRVLDLLTDLASGSDERADNYLIEPHHLSDAFQVLDNAPGVTQDQMAQLEFAFMEGLERSEYGIPNLERGVAESPTLFAQAIALCYRRSDGRQDPEDWLVEDGRREALAVAADRLLCGLKRIPGSKKDGAIDAESLRQWVKGVRERCADMGRGEVGDVRVGELLSRAPEGPDGAWPCIPVCEAMEAVASEALARGFAMGKRNLRGVIAGDPVPKDRALADTFRRWSESRRMDFPFVSTVLLDLAGSYDHSAEMWDRRATVDKRLGR